MNEYAGSLLLAPMAGVNDPVFRRICKRLGAALTYTEMISAKGLAFGNSRTADMLYMDPTEKPAAVQLFGHEPEVLAAQAAWLEQHHGQDIALIDINMGCPARKIAGKGDGAALMCDAGLAERIIRAVVAATTLPVTVKLRKGYELGEDTAVEFARLAEASGAAAVAVHGRYAMQYYHGPADKQLIGQVKQAVRIPVIASGDVFSSADANYYLQEQGADAVMAARGAQGNPWLFAGYQPQLAERVAVAREHALGLAELLPRRLASMRKHIAWYFKGTRQATEIRRAVQVCRTLEDYLMLLGGIETTQSPDS
ncbi:MAG: tRNA dihydrouridine synthase DusB [Coriobacteriales bacterium]|jgi:nifR3 family TIM-barrel protein|nr:tRNA dihydrouridine synthase DusB [Coriobacteriales bacterium]